VTSLSIDPDVVPIPATNGEAVEYHASITALCDEVVSTITNINSPDGPLNQAESRRESEETIEAAGQRQGEIIDRLEWLATEIAERIAVSEDDLDAKTRALDALTSVSSWDRESLRLIHISIGRDRGRLIREPKDWSIARSLRRGWLSLRFGG